MAAGVTSIPALAGPSEPPGVTHQGFAARRCVTIATAAESSHGQTMQDADHERFTRCWTQAQPAIAGYITAVVGDPHAADDVLQNVAMALLRKFADYDPTRPFIAWAMGVAKMQILSQRRDAARAAERFTDATVEALAVDWEALLPESDARARALAGCLEQVGGRGRELVALRYQQALAPQDIAARLGTSGGAVRTALARLRAILHDCVQRRLAATGAG